jgi:hypothetical protein
MNTINICELCYSCYISTYKCESCDHRSSLITYITIPKNEYNKGKFKVKSFEEAHENRDKILSSTDRYGVKYNPEIHMNFIFTSNT